LSGGFFRASLCFRRHDAKSPRAVG
jgi:hypothetical protein